MNNLEDLDKQLEFIRKADKLKTVFRRNSLISANRFENSAEHSWHLALMATILAGHANEAVDVGKVVCMLLIHDLVELEAGDTFLFDDQARIDNKAREVDAAEQLFGLLPEKQFHGLKTLWMEFEDGQTPEARFARALDHLLPVLQNTANKGGCWKEEGISLNNVVQKNSVIQYGSRVLWDAAERLIEECYEEEI